MKKLRVLLIFLLFSLLACDPRYRRHLPLSGINGGDGSSGKAGFGGGGFGGGGPGGGGSGGGAPGVTFSQDIKPLFKQHCSTCHPGMKPHDDWLNYSDVTASWDKIWGHVTGTIPPQMPLGLPPLSDKELEILDQWAQEGFPK